MSEKQDTTPLKAVTAKKTPKCNSCNVKYKLPAGLRKHVQTHHELENKENKPKTKKKAKTAVGAHSGVLPNPKLRQAFQGLKTKLAGYQCSQVSSIRREAEILGTPKRKRSEETLEGEYEKLKDLDINNWEQVSGPRP